MKSRSCSFTPKNLIFLCHKEVQLWTDPRNDKWDNDFVHTKYIKMKCTSFWVNLNQNHIYPYCIPVKSSSHLFTLPFWIPSQNGSAVNQQQDKWTAGDSGSQIQNVELSSGKGNTKLHDQCWGYPPIQVMDWILHSGFTLLACLRLQPS